MEAWEATSIRYIKLGEQGRWAKKCFESNVLRFGFSSGTDKVRNLCLPFFNRTALIEHWISGGRSAQTATNFTNQMQKYFEDIGETLWVTIDNGYLYYGFTDGKEIISDTNEEFFDGVDLSSHRRMDANGWRREDANGVLLKVNVLSGRLTQIVGFQGTSCGFNNQVEEYLRARLRGSLNPSVLEVAHTLENLQTQITQLIIDLHWKDFELLIQLIFANSGWKQIFSVGGAKATIDLELQNPITGDVSFVQVKSRASTAILIDYIDKMNASYYGRMFFVYHTGNVDATNIDPNITVWDVKKVAEQVVKNGLIEWLMNKVK